MELTADLCCIFVKVRRDATQIQRNPINVPVAYGLAAPEIAKNITQELTRSFQLAMGV
jgi:uncharacterized alkaline shock family protein YloU